MMKKTLTLAAVAIATLASCSKVEVKSAQDTLSFNPQAITTKGLILPGFNKEDPDQAFPSTETFGVFAYVDNNYVTPLMNDIEIVNQNGDWKANSSTPYIWPDAGSADFYAYHPYSLTAAFNSTNKKIELTSVNLGATIGAQIDPLVASTIGQDCSTRPHPAVNLVFKHITSQVAITAYDATKAAALQGKIQLTGVEFINMSTEGDYVDGTTTGKGTWSSQNGISTITVFSGAEYLPVGIANESYLSSGSFAQSIDNSSAFVTIPCDVLEKTQAKAQAVKITYNVKEYKINGYTYPAVASKTETVYLHGFNSNNEFACGKRYVYHIGISLDGANNEIMFSPVVSGWENEDITGIVIDAVNGGLL